MTDFVSDPISPPFWDLCKMSVVGKPTTEDSADAKAMRKKEVVLGIAPGCVL